MHIDRFVSRHRLALLLVGLHTLLVGAWAWIELDDAWNDMNPTMLVMAALFLVDYPLHVALRPVIDQAENTGTYLVTLLVLGGALWFAVGSLIAYVMRELRHLVLSHRSAPNGG